MSILFAAANLSLVRGTTWLQDLVLTDQETGDPVNLTGCAITMRIRETIDSAAVLLELSTVNGRLTIGVTPTTGEVTLRVEAEDTLDFPANDYERAQYVYDAIIDRTGPPAQREPAISGKVNVLPQVTRLGET